VNSSLPSVLCVPPIPEPVTYEKLEDRGELQRLGQFGRRPGQSRHRGSGIRAVELRLVLPGRFLHQFLTRIRSTQSVGFSLH